MTRTSVPSSFAVLMAGVVLAGVGLGFAVAPDDGGRTGDTTATTARQEPAATLAPTTRPPRDLSCRAAGTFPALVTQPSFVAGRHEGVVRGIGRAFSASVAIIAAEPHSLRGYLPDAAGIVVLPFKDHPEAFSITTSRAVRFVFYDAGPDAATQTVLPRPALLVTPGAEALVGREDAIVELLKHPEACP